MANLVKLFGSEPAFSLKAMLASISPLRPFRAWAKYVRDMEAQAEAWNAEGLCGECGEFPVGEGGALCLGCRGNQSAAP